MGTPNKGRELRGQALELRLQGMSYPQIAAQLGISKSTCSAWLRDLSPGSRPRRTRRPSLGGQEQPRRRHGNAELRSLLSVLSGDGVEKDSELEPLPPKSGGIPGLDVPGAPGDLARGARWLRVRGWSIPEISQLLEVPATTLATWCSAAKLPEPRPDAVEASRRRRQDRAGAIAAAIGRLDHRDLVILGLVAYWCEGSKIKPWQSSQRVTFVNTDIHLIRMFLRLLDFAGVADEDRRFRIQIHETADVGAAERSWAEDLGFSVDLLQRTTLKRHNPRTNRRNVSAGYRGCLCVTVARSAALQEVLEAGFQALAGLASVHPQRGDGPE